MNKNILITIVVLFLIITIVLFLQNIKSKNFNNLKNNDDSNQLTASSTEVIEDTDQTKGVIYVILSNGDKLKIAQSNGPKDVSEIYDIITYRNTYISPNKKFVAVEATGFEESFVEVYDVATNILHRRTHGDVIKWNDSGLLEVLSCDLAREDCNNKVSISSDKPWLFKYVPGTKVGDVILTDNDDFITNIKKIKELSTFAKVLEITGTDAISGTGPFTIFAPNNQAFEGLPEGTLEELFKEENKQKLIDLVRNHIVPNKYNITEFENGMKINTIGNDELSFTTNDWAYVRINGESAVTYTNIYSSNGVIHLIDKVLP